MENNTREVFNLLGNGDLYELLRRKEKFSEYIDGEFSEHFKDLISEILELQKEIEINGDVKSEVMDVVYMVAQLLNKMNKSGLLKGVNFKDHKGKIFQRSPNLKKSQKVSRKQENEEWKKRKNI